MRKGSKCSDIFLQNRLIFAKKPKKREESKIFKDFLAEHIKSLPGSLKYFCAKHITFSQERNTHYENTYFEYASRWLLSSYIIIVFDMYINALGVLQLSYLFGD